MELKEYQRTALETYERWLQVLETMRLKTESKETKDAIKKFQAAGMEVSPDQLNYPKKAWDALRKEGGVAKTAGQYINRTDGAGRPIPHICFKVPTGGGKTLMAASALERLNRPNGLTLWIVPSRAIYDQTKKALWNRGHPYRQMLERASGGRVKMMEKEDRLTANDVENYLCVMLLMYPATNQKSLDFLRMFRDSGRYPTFFPDSDDYAAHETLLESHPDLDRPEHLTFEHRVPVKHSLFNVFKMTRPVIVLDEAHKAYGSTKISKKQEFAESVSRLNPRLVIELSATPNRGISNLLVDIDGLALKQEQMIKLPIQVASATNVEWQFTLTMAHKELEQLDAEARAYEKSGGRYIRPIGVVRVERTGTDQRDGERVHAEDVREFLTRNLGVPSDSVKVKSASVDELGKDDLLSKFSDIRWIITKSALMEGWDCPFAYVLTMLDNTQAQRAITQLVGRVMRQPYAQRTGNKKLDQCYVYCWNADVGLAVQQVKNGLEKQGLTGLGGEVFQPSEETRAVTLLRRKRYQNQEIYLPLTLHEDGGEWIELDYQRHILSAISWESIQTPDPKLLLSNSRNVHQAEVDLDSKGARERYYGPKTVEVDKSFKLAWYARRLSDIVPNPWQAARIVQDMESRLREENMKDEAIYDNRSVLADQLRQHVMSETERMAEQAFKEKLTRGSIKFSLEAGSPKYRMAKQYEIRTPEDAGIMPGDDGRQLRFSLFEPIYMAHFDSKLEQKFARYLDAQKALRWWHRVAARQRGDYYLRGWKRNRIWPDFIAMAGEAEGKPHLLVFETKGEHLNNPDTDYKKRVMETLENAFNCGTMTVRDGPAQGTFQIVFNEADFAEALSSVSGYGV